MMRFCSSTEQVRKVERAKKIAKLKPVYLLTVNRDPMSITDVIIVFHVLSSSPLSSRSFTVKCDVGTSRRRGRRSNANLHQPSPEVTSPTTEIHNARSGEEQQWRGHPVLPVCCEAMLNTKRAKRKIFIRRHPILIVFVVIGILNVASAFTITKSAKADESTKENITVSSTRGRKIRRNELVVFFPTSAHRKNNNQWIVPIHGWIFDEERRIFSRRAFLALLRSAFNRNHHKEHATDASDEVQLLQEAPETVSEEKAKKILTRRVQPFIVDNHRRRTMTIKLANSDIVREIPERSRKNGHFQADLVFDEDELEGFLVNDNNKKNTAKLEFEAITGIENDTRSFRGSSLLIPTTGLSVISDIDDTVKISDVLDKKKLLRHTFLEEFEAVPGMPELYQTWRDERKASFHFVSSSPWQLYEELADFFNRAGFPDASLHLKSIRLKDRTLLNLFADPAQSKISKICSIIDAYPQRKFVMVGDTGERDPEVYGEICRRYPNHIQRVFLRDVTSDLSDEIVAKLNQKNEKKKTGIVVNSPDRYSNAFYGVPKKVWSIFRDASEIKL